MAKVDKYRHRRMCEGKVSYPSLAQAQKVANRARSQKDENGMPKVMGISAYGCHCGKFHIGHGPAIYGIPLDEIGRVVA